MLKKSPYVLPPVRPLPNIELIEAAKRGDVAGVRAALSAGAFINTRDAASKSAMHYAAAGRHVAALREVCTPLPVHLQLEAWESCNLCFTSLKHCSCAYSRRP